MECFATARPCGNGPSDLLMTSVEVTQPEQNLDRKRPAELGSVGSVGSGLRPALWS